MNRIRMRCGQFEVMAGLLARCYHREMKKNPQKKTNKAKKTLRKLEKKQENCHRVYRMLPCCGLSNDQGNYSLVKGERHGGREEKSERER